MLTGKNRELIVLLIRAMNYEKCDRFISLGSGGHYTEAQKEYALDLIREHGIRGTARILQIPRRTLQRWCRKYYIPVKRCPDWVYEWAERRRKRREFWERRGYF